MSMTDEIKKVVAEGVEDESVTQDENLESADEVVEEEVEVTEAKVKEEEEDEKDSEEEDEEEVEESADEDESDEDDEEEVEEISIPKTKAGVINAALDMLKKARKDEAQQLFAKMVKQVSESEDEGGKVKKAEKAGPGKAKVEDADWDEDLDLIVAEEATLSNGFRDKAGAIFEAAYKSKVSAEIDRLESEYAQNLESEVNDLNESLVEKVDSYLNYVVENWINENEVAIEAGLRTEIAEQFMDSLQTVFKEHYIEVPEGKANLIDDLADQVAELEEQLNKTTEDNIQLHEKSQSFERADVVRRQSSGLAVTEAERLASLVEDIDFDDVQTFEMKVKTIKESYFDKEVKESVDEADALAGEQDNTLTESKSSSMNAYTQAISKHIK